MKDTQGTKDFYHGGAESMEKHEEFPGFIEGQGGSFASW
jgi:hypothetical protein